MQVMAKGQIVLIRKTTAVCSWLFQETERISSDHLFQVRPKQPISTTNTSNQFINGRKIVVVVINDIADDHKKFLEICSKSTEWIRIGKYNFTLAQKEMLTTNHCLNDLHLSAVQHLIKTQFNHIGGLRNTLVLQSASVVPMPTGSLQVVHSM